jgi:type II secretory ATPase GspE/PulE/Tfp pilus assembly ATPase PilB-like protein
MARKKAKKAGGKGKTRARKVDVRGQADFWRLLGNLIGTGIPLLESIELAADECCRHELIPALTRIRDGIRDGAHFSGALDEEPGLFPPVVIKLVRIGERAGCLDTICSKIAELLDAGLVTGEGEGLPLSEVKGKPAKEPAPAVETVKELVLGAIEKGASDIHLVSTEDGLQAKYRIDGALRDERMIEKKMVPGVTSRIKIMACLDICERRVPQDGKFKMKMADKEYEFRVSFIPTIYGETCVLRVLQPSTAVRSLAELGLAKDTEERLRDAAAASHGLVVVSGPTGSGKSTVLYSLVKEAGPGDLAMYSVEEPVEYRFPGVRQIQVNRRAGLTPAAALRSVLRQDPDAVVAEIGDAESLPLLLKTALTGHLVLTSMHADTVTDVIQRLRDLGAASWLISRALVLVSSQRLVRKLCDSCRTEVKPPPEQLLQAGFTEEEAQSATIFGPVGCDKCTGGYRGRRPVLEAMPVSEAIRDLIAADASPSEIKEAAVEEGMRTLRRDGIAEIIAGRTSLEEVLWVTPADS